MKKQLTRKELFDSIVAPSEQHLACVLLLDSSYSMIGDRIDSLNAAIKRFKRNVMTDEIARKRVEIAIVTFNSEVEVISDFVPIERMPTPEIRATGDTDMAGGINKAIELVKQRTREYQCLGTSFHKPWIFMITDGASNSLGDEMLQATRNIHFEHEQGCGLKFWVLGVADYDVDSMYRLTDEVVELQNEDFTAVFDWLSESMVSVSKTSVFEDAGLKYDDMPDGVIKKEEY